MPEALGHQHLNLFPQYFFPAIPENLFGLRIDQDDLALAIYHHHRIRCRLQQSAELRLRPFAVSHVANGAGNQHPLFRLQRAKTDLYRKFAPILVQAVQF